ncbi:VCBS repeat-containing protein, partial [Candidatus Sumerlaeota bacterium]|nr:VCBS repeat-containing protein [Candidatus Sumerlaeota bacterium]
ALPVLSPGDLNNDGLIDLVAGNDSGELFFIKNVGTTTSPAFAMPVPLNVGGKPLHVQAGYRGSIQGPGEARWGYTCPTLYDWNADGYLDIVMSSILGDYVVLFQEPGTDPPRFQLPQPLYCDGLELHLTWRQQPAVTDWGTTGQVCLVTFDEDDLLRCFWRLDDHNVVRGELLRLNDGRVIEANIKGAGQRGRTKLQAVDWDGDGRIDLLAGTRRWHSIPSPADGLPQSLGRNREAAVLFLRNVGTNANPVFAFNELMKFKGNRIALGIHSCSPVAVDLGSGVLDLIVGEERGSLIYYSRKDLTNCPGVW